jgi:hypothetical protein
MHSSSSLEIYSRISSAALFPDISPLCQSICRQYVAVKAGGVLSRVEGHTLQEFYTLYLTRLENQQNCLPPQDKKKPRREGGLKQTTSCRKVLLQVNFKTKKFCIAFYESYLATLYSSFPFSSEAA